MVARVQKRVVGRVERVGTVCARVDQGELDDAAVDTGRSAIGVAIHPGHATVEGPVDGGWALRVAVVSVQEAALASAASVHNLLISDRLL